MGQCFLKEQDNLIQISKWNHDRLIGSLSDWRYAIYSEIVGLAEAVAFLHDKNRGSIAIHRDIKPANILIHEGKFKLSDFSLSQFKTCEETSTTKWLLGTPMYEPPERDTSDMLGRARDVWAPGCVFFELSLMIRFAFHDFMEELYGPEDDNIIDLCETHRLEYSGFEETKTYHITLECVLGWIDDFEFMEDGLDKTITDSGVLPVVRRMLDTAPKGRTTAKEAALKLKSACNALQQHPRYAVKYMSTKGPTVKKSSVFETSKRAKDESRALSRPAPTYEPINAFRDIYNNY
ncbi:kinase-like protein [Cadophora sp. DSE1049]|nr:kinase-like protein [Cadophora sp. DSE1049]